MAKYLSGKTVCWLQLKSDGHPASYSQAERLCHPLGFLSELKGKNRDWSCPPRAEVHNETRKKEQTQLLDTPGDVSLVTRGDEGKRKTYWQHPETLWGGGNSSGKAAKPGLCLISNFKEVNSSELIGPKPKYGQVWNMWSPQHPGGCERWRLRKATGNLPLFFFLFSFFLFPLPPIFSACLPPLSLCFGLTASELPWTWWCRPTTEQNTQM